MNKLGFIFIFIAVALMSISSPSQAQPPTVTLQPFSSGLSLPIGITNAGDGSGRLFVVQQRGLIRKIAADGTLQATAYLDLTSRVSQSGSESGLLGLAFHPDFAAAVPNPNRGRIFVHFTLRDDPGADDSIIADYFASDPAADVASVGAERIILGPVTQPETNHNGGMIAFNPGETGMLYIALGDGGGGGDFHGVDGNGQNTNTMLGKILRIDVNSTPDVSKNYKVPTDNPFFGGGGLGEIYAYGLRNPFRISFDRQQVSGVHRLFAGDVGQNRREEISLIANGDNLGWRIMEGTECFNKDDFFTPLGSCTTTGLTLPIHDYPRSDGTTVTGGYVYRGTAIPGLQGYYVFGDYGSGRIWALQETSPGTWSRHTLLTPGQTGLAGRLSSFGEDEDGEIYVCDINGNILKLVGVPPLDVHGWQFF